MNWSSKSLLIFDDQVLFRDETRYWGNESHALFLLGAGRRFGEVTFLARVAPRPQSAPYPIPPNVKVCPLDYYENIAVLCARFLYYAPRIARLLWNRFEEWDVLWLVWPHPISLLVLILLRIYGKEQVVCLFVRGNYDSVVRLRYAGLRKLAAMSLGAFMHGQFRLWGRGAIVFTVGDEMYDQYRKTGNLVRNITCSLLAKRDLAPLESKAPILEQEPLHLLYVGRLEPEKGLSYLIKAVAILHRAPSCLHLNLVGEGAHETTLRALVKSQGLEGVVTFHGYCPFGEKLIDHYRRADLFVLPSLTEGVPKALIESMVFGLPIIATRVGGISSVIRHRKNGWLIEPGSVEALIAAIRDATGSMTLRETVRQQAQRDVIPLLVETQETVIYQSLQELLSE